MPKGKSYKTDEPAKPRKAKKPPAPQLEQAPNFRLVSSSEVVARLRGLGKGWNDDIEKMLSLPPNLYESTGPASRYYSLEQDFGISQIMQDLIAGSISRPKTEYGIALYQTAGNLYFVLADINRRIIVRERLMCDYDEPPEKEWANIQKAIELSVASASKAPSGSLVIFDGIVRVITPVKAAEEEPLETRFAPAVPAAKKNV